MIHLYPSDLEKYLSKKDYIYIPRQLKQDEGLKIYKRYWSIYESINYKVDQIFTDKNNIEYYNVKYSGLFFGTITYPVKDTYELMIDKNNIKSLDNIINTNRMYSGAEIKFWFYIKNNLNSEKFNGFLSFLDPNSKNQISDNKMYYLYANEQNGIYKDCKISTYKAKNKEV